MRKELTYLSILPIILSSPMRLAAPAAPETSDFISGCGLPCCAEIPVSTIMGRVLSFSNSGSSSGVLRAWVVARSGVSSARVSSSDISSSDPETGRRMVSTCSSCPSLVTSSLELFPGCSWIAGKSSRTLFCCPCTNCRDCGNFFCSSCGSFSCRGLRGATRNSLRRFT